MFLKDTAPRAMASADPSPRPDFCRTFLTSLAVGLLLGAPLTLAAFLMLDVSGADVGPAPVSSDPSGILKILRNSSGRSSDHLSGSRTVSEKVKAAGAGAASARPVLTDGIFWSEFAESLVPHGFDDEDLQRWKRLLNATGVQRISEGECGRMQNRKILFSDGTPSCCRYRVSDDQILGEILSFHLARILGFSRNLPPTALVLVDRLKFSPAARAGAVAARWRPDRPVVLTRFVSALGPAPIPAQLRRSRSRRLHPEDVLGLSNASQISELVQWTDMIVFDYLTANPDRVVNNLHNEAWAPDMMARPAHNLARSPDGLLLFLDNESGLAHGYRLLDRYEPLHRTLLDALCVFRKRTVDALARLASEDSAGALLGRALAAEGPAADRVPFLPDAHLRTLRTRMSAVLRQVTRCRSKLSS